MTLQERFEQLIAHDELADLLARFDDVVIRNDRDAFRELWSEDGEWEISAPVPMQATGRDAILAALAKFHKANQFFFRITGRPAIQLNGERAILRSSTAELARREGGFVYANTAVYVDEAVRNDSGWRFRRRFYQYLWVDLKTPLPGEVVRLSTLEPHPELLSVNGRQ